MGVGLDKTSQKRLRAVHPDLVRFAHALHAEIPIMVVCGHRGKEEQDAAVKGGFSKTPWPKSKHNRVPSLAVDIAPLPLDWSDIEAFDRMGELAEQVALKIGVELVWGGRWRMRDRPHFELVDGPKAG